MIQRGVGLSPEIHQSLQFMESSIGAECIPLHMVPRSKLPEEFFVLPYRVKTPRLKITALYKCFRAH